MLEPLSQVFRSELLAGLPVFCDVECLKRHRAAHPHHPEVEEARRQLRFWRPVAEEQGAAIPADGDHR